MVVLMHRSHLGLSAQSLSAVMRLCIVFCLLYKEAPLAKVERIPGLLVRATGTRNWAGQVMSYHFYSPGVYHVPNFLGKNWPPQGDGWKVTRLCRWVYQEWDYGLQNHGQQLPVVCEHLGYSNLITKRTRTMSGAFFFGEQYLHGMLLIPKCLLLTSHYERLMLTLTWAQTSWNCLCLFTPSTSKPSTL